MTLGVFGAFCYFSPIKPSVWINFVEFLNGKTPKQKNHSVVPQKLYTMYTTFCVPIYFFLFGRF